MFVSAGLAGFGLMRYFNMTQPRVKAKCEERPQLPPTEDWEYERDDELVTKEMEENYKYVNDIKKEWIES